VVAAIVALTVAGCGPDSAGADKAASTTAPATTVPATTVPATTPAATAASAAPAPPQGKTITVGIADGKVTPKSGRVAVARGERVRLVVTSDVADEVHIHGYDQELRLTPGEPAALEFTADQTGLFEVEAHETKLILFQLLVR
jgi:heme/copper-type cytochrome/quinol oxidase subunit 2